MQGLIESTTFSATNQKNECRTDEELLLAYRESGDRAAFETLVKRYESEMYYYLRQYLCDSYLAEDVFQTTFFLVHEKCCLFEEGRSFRPWLYRIATNQAIDAKRRHNKHKQTTVSIDAGYDCVEAWNYYSDQLVSDEPEPSESVSGFERAAQVRGAVEQLPEQLRQVLSLVYFQGKTYREAADTLDIPFGTVKSRLNMAIRKLNFVLCENL